MTTQGERPFNLELQIVGPNNAETVQINDINEDTPTVHLPIPKDVDRDGGSFEVDIGWSSNSLLPNSEDSHVICLVSIEDSHGCKRSVSVPGLTVNVRRVKVYLIHSLLLAPH